MAHDIFISYAKPDAETAVAVADQLEEAGIRCWYAPRDIAAGSQWGASIVDAIDAAGSVLLFLSSHANDSQHVRNELERAVNRRAPIIPFRLEDIEPSREIELFVSSTHWLDAFPPPLDPHVDELAATIRAILAGDPPPAPSRPRTPRRAKRALARVVLLLLLLGAAAAAYVFIPRGPSTSEVAAAYERIDKLHRQTRDLPHKSNPDVQKHLAAADAARERAQGYDKRGELEAAARTITTAARNYEAALRIERLAAAADEAELASERAHGPRTRSAHPHVKSAYAEAAGAEQRAKAAHEERGYAAAREAYVAATDLFKAANRLNAAALSAEGARRADALPSKAKWNRLTFMSKALGTFRDESRRAGTEYKAGQFAQAEQLWKQAGARIPKLLTANKAATEVQALYSKVDQELGAKQEAIAKSLRAEWKVRRDRLLGAGGRMHAGELDETRIVLDELHPQALSLWKRHSELAQRAKQELQSIPGGARVFLRHPKEAKRLRESLETARTDYVAHDYEAVVQLVSKVRRTLEQLEVADRKAAQAKLDSWEAEWKANCPPKWYRRVSGDAREARRQVRLGAKTALRKGDFERVHSIVDEAISEVRSCRELHDEAEKDAEKAKRAWRDRLAKLPAAVRAEQEKELGGPIESAWKYADYDAVEDLCYKAKRAAEKLLATQKAWTVLRAGTTWVATGEYLKERMRVTLRVTARNFGRFSGEIQVEGRSAIRVSGSLDGTRMTLHAKDQRSFLTIKDGRLHGGHLLLGNDRPRWLNRISPFQRQ